MPFIVIDRSLAEPAPVTTLGAPGVGGSTTLESMVAELDALALGRGDIDEPRIISWINEAYLDLYTSLDFDVYSLGIELVAGQPFYELPEVVASLVGVSVVVEGSPLGGYPLEKTDLAYYRGLPVKGARPELFFKQGSILVVYPTPKEAEVLALDFRLRPVPLKLPQHSPILGAEWHEAIKLGARARLHGALHEFDKKQIVENDFISFIRRKKDPESLEDENRLVRSSVPTKFLRKRPGELL